MLLALRSLWEAIVGPVVTARNSRSTLSLVHPYRASISLDSHFRATVSIE